MMNTRAEAYAPATIANLGVGFDILGLALDEPGDYVTALPSDEPGVRIASITGDGGLLPLEASKNTAGVAALSLLKQLGVSTGVILHIRKNLPLSSGLGSSAASAVAAAVAVNALMGNPYSDNELLPACLDGEASVSGYHADNVGPSLFGGLMLVAGIRADQIHQLPVPNSLHLALITPDVAVPTALARSVLPSSVPLKTMVAQTASVARLLNAIYRNDLEDMAHAMESDQVIEPARAHLMPLLTEMRQVAREHGALGLVISGAGPTLCAICDDPQTAEKVSLALKDRYTLAGISSEARSTQISANGARITALN